MVRSCASVVSLKVLHTYNMLCKSLSPGQRILTPQSDDISKTKQPYRNFRFTFPRDANHKTNKIY